MASLTIEYINTVNLQKSDFMDGDECLGICLFKVIASKSQVDSRSTIKLLLSKLTTGMPDIMELFGKNIGDFNK